MNTQKLTQKSIEVINNAQSIAQEYGNQQLEQAHFLKALVDQENGITGELLKKCGVDKKSFADAVVNLIESYPKVSGNVSVYISQTADRALTAAEKLAERMGDEYTSVEHLFLGIVNEADRNIKEILKTFGVSSDRLM